MYFVTGCAGFIGWKVTEALLTEGRNVIGVDNLNDAYDIRLKEWRLRQLMKYPSFHFYHLDITDLEGLREIFKTSTFSFRVVINLAARAGVRESINNPQLYYETNVKGTLNLLEMCRVFGVKRFILASTSSLYGSKTPLPFKEDAFTDSPLSPYAASKKAAETLCYTYHHLFGLSIIILRYFTVYGPAGRPDMSIFRFVQRIIEGRPVEIYGNGSQSRDFTYVEDIAKGTLLAINYLEGNWQNPPFEIINLGSDRPVKVLEVLQIVERLTDKKAFVEHKPKHPADMEATWAHISKAKNLLGWQPETPLEEGLRRTIEWYIENSFWAREILT